MTSPLVVFEDVVKDYPLGILGGIFGLGPSKLRAVDRVRFRLEPGEVFGLVGPNRAGKTTLVKLLLGLCRPTTGKVWRLGRPSHERATLAQVGYVHENPAFPRYYSAQALLEFYGALSLLPEPEVKARVGELLEKVGLADRSREPISRFSKGMLQRLGLAQALINDPRLLVLDEPSEGLDLSGRRLIRSFMNEQRQKGGTVLYVSHHLEEVEQVCDRVGVLVQGRLVFVGPLQQLTKDPGTGMSRPLEESLAKLYQTGLYPRGQRETRERILA